MSGIDIFNPNEVEIFEMKCPTLDRV